MNPFQKMMNDIFSNKDFLEQCLIEDTYYECITSPIEDAIAYTETGVESEENFTLDLKLPLIPMPNKGDKVTFREKLYKISDITVDSANTSVKIHLIALSKGISR